MISQRNRDKKAGKKTHVLFLVQEPIALLNYSSGLSFVEMLNETRMHSSRMRTIRCSGRLIWRDVCSGGGGFLPRGGGLCPGAVNLPRVDRRTLVKT